MMSSTIVHIIGDRIIAENNLGEILSQGIKERDDTKVIQDAVDTAVQSGGELKILKGTYNLTESIVVRSGCTISGEGWGTTLVPPDDDYALKLIKDRESPLFETLFVEDGNMLKSRWPFGIVLKDFTINGKKKGKGIYMNFVFESNLENLWFHNIYSGAALFLDESVRECSFSKLYFFDTGSPENGQASIVIASQKSGDAHNNLRFDRVQVIFPRYRGVDIGYGDFPSKPRLIFFTQSMFHGLLPIQSAPPYDLIYIGNANTTVGIVISESRITNTQDGYAFVHLIRGSLTMNNCVIGGGRGTYAVKAEKESKLILTGNTFHGGPSNQEYSVYLAGGEIIFTGNSLQGSGNRVCLVPASKAVIANNIFDSDCENDYCILIGDDGQNVSCNVDVSNNIFSGAQGNKAVRVSDMVQRSQDVNISV